MKRKLFVIQLLVSVGGLTKIKAEQIVELLTEEGLLHLGFGDVEVDAIIDKFSLTFGNTKTTKYDRFAASRLANKYGSQSVVGIIGLLGSLSNEKYAPVVNNVSELESKMVSIISFLRKQKGDEVIVV